MYSILTNELTLNYIYICSRLQHFHLDVEYAAFLLSTAENSIYLLRTGMDI